MNAELDKLTDLVATELERLETVERCNETLVTLRQSESSEEIIAWHEKTLEMCNELYAQASTRRKSVQAAMLLMGLIDEDMDARINEGFADISK